MLILLPTLFCSICAEVVLSTHLLSSTIYFSANNKDMKTEQKKKKKKNKNRHGVWTERT